MGEVNLDQYEKHEIKSSNKCLDEVTKEALTKNLVDIDWNGWKKWAKENPIK